MPVNDRVGEEDVILKSRKGEGRRKSEGRKKGKGVEVEREDEDEPSVAGAELGVGDASMEAEPIGAEKSPAEKEDVQEWDWLSLLDSEVSTHPAVFTKDRRYFFLPSGVSVKVYSASTGEVLSTLAGPSPQSTEGNETPSLATVTCLCLNPANQFQLLTGSLDGMVRVWDFLDGVLLRTVEVGHPVTHMCAHEKYRDGLFVAVSKPPKKRANADGTPKPRSVVYRISISATPSIQVVGKAQRATAMAMSSSGSHLVVTASRSAYVYSISSEGKPPHVKYVSTDKLTCVAFHPEEEWFATGDDKGVVKFWYCISGDEPRGTKGKGEKHAPTTSHHWHAHPVTSLAFTPNGAYLLSGGEEAVIVAWQLHSGRKEFVPRLGGPIKWVSVRESADGEGEEEWVAGLADGTLVWVGSGSLKITKTVARIKLDPSSLPSPLPSSIPLAVHPITSHLILPSSHPSSLQIYSPTTHTLLSEVEVHPSNRVSRRDPTSSPPPSSRVERVALSPRGEWMATIDVRRGGEEDVDLDLEEGGALTRLKIWRWVGGVGKEKGWRLNTRVERPHGVGEVTGLVFSPLSGWQARDERDCILVTTGGDGLVKTWRVRVVKDKGGEEVFWVNRSSFSYRSHPPNHASFSPDGSLLAIAQGPCITLWDPQTDTLRRVLTSLEAERVEEVRFVGPLGKWVVGVEKERGRGRGGAVVLWDVLSCSMVWRRRLDSADVRIAIHPTEPTFAVFEQTTPAAKAENPSTCVLLFNTASSRPFRIRSLPFGVQEVCWYPAAGPSFSPLSPSQGFSLLGLTHQMNVVLLGDSVPKPISEGSTPRDIRYAISRGRKTLFQDVFGTSALAEVAQNTLPAGNLAGVGEHVTGKADESIFDGPSYMLPPISTLFGSYMEGILQRRDAVEQEPVVSAEEVEQEEQEDAMDVDVDELPRRVVDDAEMDMLVGFFKQQMFRDSHTPPPAPTAPRINGNGKHKSHHTNGNGNGSSSSPSRSPSRLQIQTRPKS